jgi:hypothetical protein
LGDADNEGSLTAQPKLLKVPLLTYDYLPMYNIWIYPVTEIMLKMALNTISVTPNPCYTVFRDISLYYISYKYFRDKQLGFIMVDNSEVVEGSSPGSYTILNTNQILYIGK